MDVYAGNYGFTVAGDRVVRGTFDKDGMHPAENGVILLREALLMWEVGSEYAEAVRTWAEKMRPCPWKVVDTDCYVNHRPSVPSFEALLEYDELYPSIIEDIPSIDYGYFVDLDEGTFHIRVGADNVEDIAQLEFLLSDTHLISQLADGDDFAAWVDHHSPNATLGGQFLPPDKQSPYAVG